MSVLRISNIPSFQVFEDLVIGAVKSQEGKVKEVQIVKGITDFDAIFQSSIPNDVQGTNKIESYINILLYL